MKSKVMLRPIKSMKKYPSLRKDSDGTIILFSSENTGFVVHAVVGGFWIGYSSNHWSVDKTTLFNDTLILEN